MQRLIQVDGGVRNDPPALKNSEAAVANKDNLTPWQKGQSGNPKGAPPKLETALKNHFLGEHNIRLSNSQVTELLTVFLSKTKTELLAMAKDDGLPFWVELLVRKAAKDANTGSIELLEKILDRIFGKPKQQDSDKPTGTHITLKFTTDDSDPTE